MNIQHPTSNAQHRTLNCGTPAAANLIKESLTEPLKTVGAASCRDELLERTPIRGKMPRPQKTSKAKLHTFFEVGRSMFNVGCPVFVLLAF